MVFSAVRAPRAPFYRAALRVRADNLLYTTIAGAGLRRYQVENAEENGRNEPAACVRLQNASANTRFIILLPYILFLSYTRRSARHYPCCNLTM